MKLYITIIVVFFIFHGFSQTKGSEVFAKIHGDKFLIVGDSLRLKAKMSHLISADIKVTLNLNMKVGKNQTFGEKVEDYYFVLLQDKKNNITIARWLEKVGDNLLVIDEFNDKNYWQVLTTACLGKDDCTPQVVIIDSEKNWGCGHKLICGNGSDCKKISGMETE